MSYDEEIAKADALVRELEAKPLRTLPPATNWKLSATASPGRIHEPMSEIEKSPTAPGAGRR
jgi:hypothetical protein